MVDLENELRKHGLLGGFLELRSVEAQVCDATYVKEHTLAYVYKTKEHMLAD